MLLLSKLFATACARFLKAKRRQTSVQQHGSDTPFGRYLSYGSVRTRAIDPRQITGGNFFPRSAARFCRRVIPPSPPVFSHFPGSPFRITDVKRDKSEQILTLTDFGFSDDTDTFVFK